MQSLTAPLDIRYDAEASKVLGADHWRVITPFRYYLGEKYSEQWVTVPTGYLTDGASVPQLLWSLIPPWGSYGQAAVLHDLLCEYLSIVVAGELVNITRERCDEIFYESMGVLGVLAWKRWVIYRGVSAYRKLARVEKRTTIPLKRKLEAAWQATPREAFRSS